MEYPSFKTQRLLLRPTQEDDAEFILELFNSHNWITFIGDRNVNTAEEARVYIRDKMLPPLEEHGFSTYTLIRKSDQNKIGTVGLYDRKGLEGIDLGFALLPQYEKQGYAFEASNKLVGVAFEVLGLHTLKAITTDANLGSQKLLEKLNFTMTGYTELPEKEESFLLYILNRSKK